MFNDLLGFRVIAEYDSILSQELSKFRVVNSEVRAYLRKLYEDGIITNEKEFKEVLNNVLSSGQEI